MNLLDLFLILTAVALIFWADAVLRAVDWSITWFQFHRVCGWCRRHQGGNPFAAPKPSAPPPRWPANN